jgi:HAD superfamily hydrolase (TIGR01458 family)
VLLDIDGTLLVGDRAIEGAVEALGRLREAGIPYRLFTNITRKGRSAIARALGEAGIAAREDEILTPSVLARRRIVESGRRRAALLVPDAAKVDFDGVEEVGDIGDGPDWVVVGDLGADFTWDRLNRAFRMLLGGARLLALHRNRYWTPDEREVVLDAGAFVAALEYAAGAQAEVVGKPSRSFFELALGTLGLAPGEVLVVGDDVEADGHGGALAGCRTALVRTGKFSQQALEAAGLSPDLVLDSVAALEVQSSNC